jgi:Gram-negative bacterial TonB protein C-terminal
MKLTRILFVVIILSAVNCFAQETKWTRIEFEKKVSFSIPDGYLVTKASNCKNCGYRFIYYKTNFHIDVEISGSSTYYSAKTQVNNFRAESNDSEKIEIDKVIIRRFIFNRKRIKSVIVLIATDDYYYKISVGAEKESDLRLLKLVNSIKINGKSIFPQEIDETLFSENSINGLYLKTSPEVDKALSRQIRENPIYKVVASTSELNNASNFKNNYSRLLFFLEEPSWYRPFYKEMLEKKILGKVTVSATLKADGEIDDIKVVTTVDKKITDLIVKSVQAKKFVPAQIDGKDVDYNFFMEYNLDFSDGNILKG